MATVKKRSGRTLFALGLGYLVDQGESQSMGVLAPVIQKLWNVSHSWIGWMDTLRVVTSTVSAPLWGYAADRFSRKKVLFFGTGIWGIWTVLVGLMPGWGSLVAVRVVSGLGLGCLMPASFSIIADHFPQSRRGRALGIIGLVGLMGTVLGVLAMGFVATPRLWRWGFVGLGAASILTGFIIWAFVDEPPRGSAEPEIGELVTHEDEARYRIHVKDMIATLRIPTIWAAILQGVSGTMPWVVMALFFVNWMVGELGYANDISFSDPLRSAPVVFATIVIGAAVSNLVGGLIGDRAEKVSPRFGRTLIGQFSVLSGVPLMYVLITQGPRMSFWGFFGLAAVTALLIGWPGRGAKEPMMQAVVPPELRSSAYAVVNFFEGSLSAFGQAICGALADRIGLTKALLWTIPFPWLICTLFFAIFYFTYPKDAAKVRQKMAARREELLAVHGRK